MITAQTDDKSVSRIRECELDPNAAAVVSTVVPGINSELFFRMLSYTVPIETISKLRLGSGVL